MAYPFSSVHLKEFKNTFLRDVTLTVYFDAVKKDDKYKKALSSYIMESFHVDVGDDDLQEGSGVISADKKTSFYFASDQASVKMCYPAYKNFDLAIHWLPYLAGYVQKLGIVGKCKFHINKFNELRYDATNNDKFDLIRTMNIVFCKNLLGDSQINGDLARYEMEKDFEDEGTNTKIHLTYGFKKEDERKGSLILNASVTKHDVPFDDSVETVLRDINALLDGAFVWSLSDEIIKKMGS